MTSSLLLQAHLAQRRSFASCGRCGDSSLEGPEFFWCAACGKVPPAASAETVTYFEALGLQACFDVDLAASKPHVAKLQRRLEELARAGEDMASLQAYAARVQQAFLALQDRHRRAEYLLGLEGGGVPDYAGAERLPQVCALEDEALSAEVEDAEALQRAVGSNADALEELEARLASTLRAESWAEAGSVMLELHQRKALRRRLTDLAVENHAQTKAVQSMSNHGSAASVRAK